MPARFWPLLLTLVCCVAVEFALTTWSPDLLRQQAGMAAGPASFGVTALLVGMLVGRLLVGRLARRRSPVGLLLAALGLTAAGWLVTWTASGPATALAGLVLTGLGIAGHYPLSASLVLQASEGRGDQASGAMSIGIGVSAGGAPFALAALADRTSTHTAFLVVPALLVAAALLLGVSIRGSRATIA
jgi:fucose permease